MRIAPGGLLLSAALAFGLSSAASATATVMQEGNTYHVAACANSVGLYAHCHAHIVTDKLGHPLANKQQPIGGFAPAQLRDAYKITTDGSPSTIIAIVDAFGYPNAEADLGVYRAQWGLPPCTTANGCFKKLNQKGEEANYPDFNLGWAQESALDLDMASAMCPGCKIYLFESRSNSFGNLGRAVRRAAFMGAHVISNSYGGSEAKRVADFEKYYSWPGVAVTASTGDSGYGVQAPADMPDVIAVGGTALHADGSDRGWAETAWTGAGSGCSKVFPKPKWQHDKACSGRMEADVSAVASPGTGVAVYGPTGENTSNWLVFGGTSVSAPLVGGIFGNNGGVVKDAREIYWNRHDLFDVTTGSNGQCDHDYWCTGEKGYDGPTGFGTPNGLTAFGNPH
ncbi:MAG: S8 family serine peptidase [Alphaproteobacteria bacterium]|jgi:subtilase family serine protease